MPCKITVASAELRDGWSAVGFSSPAAALTHSIMALRLRQTEITGLRERHTGRRSVEHTCMTHEDADASARVRVRAHTYTKKERLKPEDSACLRSITTKRFLLLQRCHSG